MIEIYLIYIIISICFILQLSEVLNQFPFCISLLKDDRRFFRLSHTEGEAPNNSQL